MIQILGPLLTVMVTLFVSIGCAVAAVVFFIWAFRYGENREIARLKAELMIWREAVKQRDGRLVREKRRYAARGAWITRLTRAIGT